MKAKLRVGLSLMCAFNVGCANFVVDGEEKEPAAVEKVVPPAIAGASTPGEDEVQTSFPPQQPDAISTEPVHPYKRESNVGSVVLMSKEEAAKTAPTKNEVVKTEVIKDIPLEPISTAPTAAAEVSLTSVTIPPGVPAEKALGWLKNGNTRFVKGTVRRDGQSARDRKRVANKQTPHAVVVSCSDSVAPPELIFDQKLGEIGVVRTADGSISDVAALAVEQIVKQGAHLVVLLNYSGCGNSSIQNDAAQNLSARSALLENFIKSGQVTIKTANYDPDNGRVTF